MLSLKDNVRSVLVLSCMALEDNVYIIISIYYKVHEILYAQLLILWIRVFR